jgi:hypothetical protein
MTQYIPYFAGLVTILFGLGFFLAIKDSNNDN